MYLELFTAASETEQQRKVVYSRSKVLVESGELNTARRFLFVGGRHGSSVTQHGRTASARTWLMGRCRHCGRGRRRHHAGCSVTGQFQLQVEICMTWLHLTIVVCLDVSHTYYHQLLTSKCSSNCTVTVIQDAGNFVRVVTNHRLRLWMTQIRKLQFYSENTEKFSTIKPTNSADVTLPLMFPKLMVLSKTIYIYTATVLNPFNKSAQSN